MKLLIESTILTGVLFVCNIFFKRGHNIKVYVIYFIAIFLGNYLLSQKAEASEFIPNCEIEMKAMIFGLHHYENLTEEEREYYWKKIQFHEKEAKRTYNDAKNRCWWLPNINDRDKAKYCFTTAIAAIPANTPQSRIIMAILTFMTQYGLDCIDEWNYIQNKLHWCQYHYKQKELYEDVLKHYRDR